jgi:hypothetical protein
VDARSREESLLAPAVVDWKHIPGGVDLDVFHTGPRDAARRELGLAADANILLYVANQGSANRFKDFDVVRRALCELARRGINRQIQLLVVGATGADEEIAPASSCAISDTSPRRHGSQRFIAPPTSMCMQRSRRRSAIPWRRPGMRSADRGRIGRRRPRAPRA